MFFRKKSNPAATPDPVVVPVGADGEPDLRGLGRLLWQKKTTIIGFALICAGLAFVVVNLITPRYRAEARILLEARQNVFLRADADKNVDRTTIDPEMVASQVQVLLSRDLAREVIKKENLASMPEFDPAIVGRSPVRTLMGLFGFGRNLSSMTQEERTLEAYYDRLNVFMVGKSRVIAVDFTSANPELAAKVANTVAETYLRMQQVDKQSQTRAAGVWLAGEIEKMRQKVADAESKVEQYRSKTNLFSGANNTSLPTQQLTDLNAQIAAARAQQADLQARARQLRTQLTSGQSIESSDLANSDTMRRLIEQRIALQSQLAEQSTTLLSKHPRIQELKAQIAETSRQIRAEGQRLVRQLENDATVAGDRIQTLTASLNQVKGMASQTNSQDVELRALEREAKTERDLLASYLQKYREASARDSISAAPPEARVISRASPPLTPAFPKKLATVLIAAFAGLTLAAGFIVTGALLASPGSADPYETEDAEAEAEVRSEPELAEPALVTRTTPRVVSPSLAPEEATRQTLAGDARTDASPVSLAASSIEKITEEIKQSGDLGRRVGVIGMTRNVGTTYSAITLSRELAQGGGSVVLVDLAFQAPNLSVISTEPEAPGIAELVHGKASFSDIIACDQYSSVHLVASGEVNDEADALATSPMLGTAIGALAHSYDHVVMDLGSAADTAIERFAPLCSRLVLVTDDASRPSTRAVRERLRAAGFGEISVLVGGAEVVAA